MTTAQELIHGDIMQSGRELKRYYKATNLPFSEGYENRPDPCHYRRDRVLHRIMQLEMERALYLLGQPARKGGE